MGPDQPLPMSNVFSTPEEYVDSLLDFVATDSLLRTLCGGVHILDFFTNEPDLYSKILPDSWREFFAQHNIMDHLDLLMRVDLSELAARGDTAWRDGPAPPPSLLDYVARVRSHSLVRDVKANQCARNRAMKPTQKLARHVAVGMTVKKVHEVGLFARYISDFAHGISSSTGTEISHLVDFGSGQNYLGRALASEPYNKRIVAIESKSHNAERAKELDVMAKLAIKKKVRRDKKAFRAGQDTPEVPVDLPTPPSESELPKDPSLDPAIEASPDAKGSVQYVEHRILDGDLSSVIASIPQPEPKCMVMSLHSCGNLVHHGLRSLILNPSVRAVAMVGCCYNLLTERLGPATYKLPELRPRDHPRLTKTGQAYDPHGFPMSERFCTYGEKGEGVRLNITARMMAVQAPHHWGKKDSDDFFKRHFYRALLQRIFLDRGVVGPPSPACVGGSVSPAGHSSGGTPIVIGSLKKSCYENFVAYVRGALDKLQSDEEIGDIFRDKMEGVTDEEIEGYEVRFKERHKELSVMWSLMAFSAGVVEAAIVVDRWCWLKEQEQVGEAWVEAVFEYGISPRNMVVVGVKG